MLQHLGHQVPRRAAAINVLIVLEQSHISVSDLRLTGSYMRLLNPD
jgi:hypothetical protein